jgi:tungstate transport system substrate-binding protein
VSAAINSSWHNSQDPSNGGAGALGLIRALAEDYLSTLPSPFSITWTCNHSRNTQLALLHDYIDIALTYERHQEELAAKEGWSITAGCLFHDHFLLAGPMADPAGIRLARDLDEGMRLIAEKKCLFHARADSSATMWKERMLWGAVDLKPWEDDGASTWYKTSLLNPADALKGADKAGAYLVTDRSTLLRQTSMHNVSGTMVFFEPEQENDVLMNSCYASYRKGATAGKVKIVKDFLMYVKSDRGQGVIGEFGRTSVGVSLFATLGEGFARTKLKGGRPKDGIWMDISKL